MTWELGVEESVTSPTGGNFSFLRHLDANFVQNDIYVRFVLFTKTLNA